MKIENIDYGLSGIYKIVFENNKVYIGLSNDIRRRLNEHLRKDVSEHPDLLISKALQKHKIIDIEVLELIDEKDRVKLQEREKYWIQFYNSFQDRNKGYNMTAGGDGASSGVYNTASYIEQSTVEKIYELLKNTSLTYEDIADQTCTSYSIVSRINNGIHYHNSEISYPIRRVRAERYETNNKHSSFYNNEQKLLNLIEDLKNNILSYKQLEEKYDVKKTTLSLINQGKKYRQDDCIYPLRAIDKGASTRRIFTNEEMALIKEKLENSNASMGDIASIVKCDRKVISDINSGKRQNNLNWSYPLRKKPLKTGPKSF